MAAIDEEMTISRLENKVAVITGGAGGIGKAAGKLFVAEGADVLLVDLDEAALQAACDEIGSDKVSFCVADVTRSDDNQRMVATAAERYGGVDIFLANAGIEGDVTPIVDYNEKTFDQVIAVNVKGPFLGLRAVIPAMVQRGGGSVVITSSVTGVEARPNHALRDIETCRYRYGQICSEGMCGHEHPGEHGKPLAGGNAHDAQPRSWLFAG